VRSRNSFTSCAEIFCFPVSGAVAMNAFRSFSLDLDRAGRAVPCPARAWLAGSY
jgi:hypothetical protein